MLEVDLDQVTRIEKASMPSPWSKELFEEELRRPLARYFVVEVEGQVAGYMGYWQGPEEAQTINLAIWPDVRRQGLGAQMIERCVEFAAKRGARLATLEVREGNQAAQA